MTRTRTLGRLMGAALLASGGCYSQPADEADEASAGTAADGSSAGPTGSTAPTTAGATGDPTTGATTAPMATTNVDSTEGSTATGSTGSASPFVTDDTDPSEFARVDALGLPGVTTLAFPCLDPGMTGCLNDDYNSATQVEVSGSMFDGNLIQWMFVFVDGLRADVQGLGLADCDTPDCNAYLDDLIEPDAVRIAGPGPDAFPNGRRLDTPAMDMMLAAMLLDVATTPALFGAFAALPLNPSANDVPFAGDFPFVAAPHR